MLKVPGSGPSCAGLFHGFHWNQPCRQAGPSSGKGPPQPCGVTVSTLVGEGDGSPLHHCCYIALSQPELTVLTWLRQASARTCCSLWPKSSEFHWEVGWRAETMALRLQG